MAETALQTLQSSRDSKKLVQAALSLANSRDATDQHALLDVLRSEDFLARLDSEEAYRGRAKRLRLWRILEALSKNPAPGSQATLIALTQTPSFIKDATRVDLLIYASAVLRPPPPEVVRFWDVHSQPEDGFTPITIDAMVKNGSEPALALFEKKLAGPAHEDEDKTDWLLSSVLVHRNDVALLQSCERLLAAGLPEALRLTLVSVLFDYRPQEWYTPASLFTPPDRHQASQAALTVLHRIGEYALAKVPLTPDLRKVVKKVLVDVEEIQRP